MNPLVKKAIAALAITKGIEKIQEMRKPKRFAAPLVSRRCSPSWAWGPGSST